VKNSWPLYAFAAMCCFACLQLLFKYFSRGGMTPAAILVFVFGFGWLLYMVHVVALKTPLPSSPADLGLLLLAGAIGYVGNFCGVRAVALAPNAGYAVAIFGLQALVVTIVSGVLLGATLSGIKMLGVLLCFAGVAVLVM
jgi:drug/metabolite transporter (DMT)-like permease